TSDTLFDGPVHTNGNFNIYGRPWFGGFVSSAGVNNRGDQGAYAYDGDDGTFRTAGQLEPGGNSPNMDTRNFTNRPQFTGGVDWRADDLPLPTKAFNQDRKSTRLNSSHVKTSSAVFCAKKRASALR